MPMKPITFVVSGQDISSTPGANRHPASTGLRGAGASPGDRDATPDAAFSAAQVKQSVRVGASRGAGVPAVRMAAVPGNDVVVLHLSNGPSLFLHPVTAAELIGAQNGSQSSTRGAMSMSDASTGAIEIPAQLSWRGLEPDRSRGGARGLGDVLLTGVDILTGLVTGPIADRVVARVVDRFDGRVDDKVYPLSAETLTPLQGTAPRPMRPAADGHPLLVLLHGTFSDTSGTFSKLWTHHPQRVRRLFECYDNRVYALDHPTLAVSPVANALTLAEALPSQANLHLLTHSRGGLVAEILASVCAQPDGDHGALLDRLDASERHSFEALTRIVARKRIRVGRVARVGCPARGTLLASKRLDAYLSVVKWTLALAGVPVVAALVDVLAAVARERTDPAKLPGLAAQMPGSPWIDWLHAPGAPIAGELRAIAGDVAGDSVKSWLKTLLADAFFATDSDMVVQTRSMYGGRARSSGGTFLFDQGGAVSHFNYFHNERTATAIVDALVQDRPAGFRPIGPLSWAGQSAEGLRARVETPRVEDTSVSKRLKPVVFLVPALGASTLSRAGHRVWPGASGAEDLEHLDQGRGSKGVQPDGLIAGYYDALVRALSASHDVVPFAYDWRLPLEDGACRLAADIETALERAKGNHHPVRILAHSTGGLLARTLQLERPATWKRMMSHPDGRFVMLGTPNAGWWTPMLLLSGDDDLGGSVTALAPPLGEARVRALFARFGGVLQTQAGLLDAAMGLGSTDRWKQLAAADIAVGLNGWHDTPEQRTSRQWGVPTQATLDRAVALRNRLDLQLSSGQDTFTNRWTVVVGEAPLTADGCELDDDGVMYRYRSNAGDGRVTWDSAAIAGVSTWKVAADHAGLATREDAFAAYAELLESGRTTRLPLLPATRGHDETTAGTSTVRRRPSRSAPIQITADTGSLLGTDGIGSLEPNAAGTALRITVVNGDLMFVRDPLMIGHYRSMRLTGTERVMNRILGSVMQVSLEAGLYPDAAGSQQVFMNPTADPGNPWQLPRPEAVIVVGLGEEGKLRPADLVHTVCQGVLAWAQRMGEQRQGTPAVIDLAATLIGSGGLGMSAAQAAQSMAQGVRQANDRLSQSTDPRHAWPRVGHLQLIELYLDRATEAWRALQVQATSSPRDFEVTPIVRRGVGALRRPLDSGYRGAEYDFISAVSQDGEHGDCVIAYSLDTKRARTEVRAQATQGPLLRELIAEASTDTNRDPQIGRTLFDLLIPIEMEPFLGGTSDMVIELDQGTAGIPWELLDTAPLSRGDQRPWAIRSKLLRKLRTTVFRAQVVDASADADVLVIGEPAADPELYPRLPGARLEARAVAACLTEPGALEPERVRLLVGPDNDEEPGPGARAVINTLLERDWRIVHVAGHGEPPERIGPVPRHAGDPPQRDGDPRGVVLSNGTFLGPREIRNMRTVPELVFVNCCHLAARNVGQILAPRDRVEFAAGVADELIKIGVRCVVAAGWAVDDGAASEFAGVFYKAIVKGHRFIDAVADARTAALACGGNTWGAYQCYGDPDWTFRRSGADAQQPTTAVADEFAGIASAPALRVALDAIAVRAQYREDQRGEEVRAKLRHLDARFGSQWGRLGKVAEAFGLAWAEVGDAETAIAWYEKAVGAPDGGASMRVAEQLLNLQVRTAFETAVSAGVHQASAEKTRKGSSRPRGGRASRAGGTRSERDLQAVVRKARAAIGRAMATFEPVANAQPSMERESLRGSAYKRLAMIEAMAGSRAAEARALGKMREHYARAEAIGEESADVDAFYPAMNRIAADLAINGGRRGWSGPPASDLARLRQQLTARAQQEPDFWSIVGLTELAVYESAARRTLHADRNAIERAYKDVQSRVSTPGKWASVYDTASFVLGRYATRATGREHDAALALLQTLRTLTGK
ncbi:MAG: CHAT domain-containing protein [Vicinamibacterales bacterium]